MEAPRNLSRSGIVTWVIGVLSIVVVTLFGLWTKSQSELLEKETKRADDNQRKAEEWQNKYFECQQKNNMYEIINRFGVAPGKKNLEFTPEVNSSENEN